MNIIIVIIDSCIIDYSVKNSKLDVKKPIINQKQPL